jgi:hypothetical protein
VYYPQSSDGVLAERVVCTLASVADAAPRAVAVVVSTKAGVFTAPYVVQVLF